METIADKSRTKEIIERLQSIMDDASPVPLASGKVMIYKDEVQSLLTELTATIDMELKTYHEVNDRRGKIINEAKKEAERIIYQAEHTASRVRVNKRTTNVDPVDFSMLTQEELNALDNANEIYGASLIYTDEMLTEVSNLITETYANMKNDYEIVLQVMEEKMQTLENNRKELMDGLSEMDGKDRSQQILEIGQLLSNELFNARMNSHKNVDMYDDGSMQLTLDLKTEQELKAMEAEEKARAASLEAKEAKAYAEEVSAAVKEAEAALIEMTAERDALKEEMSKIKQGKNEDGKPEEEMTTKVQDEKHNDENDDENDDEYEIVYVTEDELEEGEEYEIEYVDEEEDFESKNDVPVEQNAGDKSGSRTAEALEDAFEGVPMIPHFTKSQKIATVPSEKVAKMAAAISTDKKYSGLISRAVEEREKSEAQAAVTVEKDNEGMATEKQPEFEIVEF